MALDNRAERAIGRRKRSLLAMGTTPTAVANMTATGAAVIGSRASRIAANRHRAMAARVGGVGGAGAAGARAAAMWMVGR